MNTINDADRAAGWAGAPGYRLTTGRSTGGFRNKLLAPLLLAAALLAALPVQAQQWVARHNLSNAQYQQEFTKHTSNGLRLVSVSGYERNGRANFAAVWAKQSGPQFAARHGLTSGQHQAAFDSLTAQGFRPVLVNGYEIGGQARYASIWERRQGAAVVARHGLTAAQYQRAVDQMTGRGFAPVHVSAFTVQGTPRFAVIFEHGGPAWVARHNLTPAAYQQAFDTFTSQGFRLKVVSGYRVGNGDRYAAIWTRASGPATVARHGIPAAHYQHVFDNMQGQGRRPVYLEAFNSSNGVRFNAIWANEAFAADDLRRIETAVQAFLQEHNIPGLSLAISREGRLVLASGYGVADRQTRLPFGTRHRARVASVSKLLTREAVQRLADAGALGLDDRVFGPNSILGARFPTPSTNRGIDAITVRHLIQHRGGLFRSAADGSSREPTFDYPHLDHSGLISFGLREYPLEYTPGDSPPPLSRRYSNFHYSVLGRVIEERSGRGYEAHVRQAILLPAGAPGMVIGGNRLADRAANEVRYNHSSAYTRVRPTVFDAHGGWIATPTDLLRFARSARTLGDTFAHGGQMAGTSAYLRQRSDGLAFAIVANGRGAGSNVLDTLMTQIIREVRRWPQHDLFS